MKPGDGRWHRIVTASKVAPILGISPYTDQYTMWHLMAGNVPPEPETEAMRRGTLHEPAVLGEYRYRHPDLMVTSGRSRSRRISRWLAVTPDAESRNDAGDVIGVEVKTASSWDDGWGEPGSDEIPEHYRAQVLVMAHVLHWDLVHIPVMGPFWDYREYLVQPDPDLAAAILTTCHRFWLSVRRGVPPPLSRTLSAYTTWTRVADPAAGDGDLEIPPDLAADYLAAGNAERALPAFKADIVNQLEAAGRRRAVVRGQVIARRQRSSSGGAALVRPRNAPHPDQIKELSA